MNIFFKMKIDDQALKMIIDSIRRNRGKENMRKRKMKMKSHKKIKKKRKSLIPHLKRD